MLKRICSSARVSLRLMRITRLRAAVSLAIVVSGLSSNAMALPAFPGAEGYGAETPGGRGGIVVQVTNLNDSGPGSFREAMMMTEPRIVVFRVSGTITLNSTIELGSANSYVTVAGQTAPGDGIALTVSDSSDRILALSGRDGGPPGAFHDGVFQHLRFRHGSAVANKDAITIRANTHHVVFDHNSFTWTGDEVLELWGDNIHDITMSHNIMGEGVVRCTSGDTQNLGPLIGGGFPHYRTTWHHNLMIHTCYRNILQAMGHDGVNAGVQFINNVNYNMGSQHFNFAQVSGQTGPHDIQVDVINSYFKEGDDGDGSIWPVTYSRANGSASQYGDISLYFVGSTWRNKDGTPHARNDEVDNYNMVDLQDFGAGAPTLVERQTPISPQPPYPVTTTSAAQAYIDVVINEDAGATKPRLDPVDKRLLGDPEDGSRWSSANVPAPRGTGSFPTLNTYDVPIDSDSDGVPDSYETSTLGTNPNSAESHAVLDHDGDGYVNIEEYIHSFSDSGFSDPVASKPNPPINMIAN